MPPLKGQIVNGLGLDIPGFDTIDEPVLLWCATLVAVTFQTLFLTPSVGFALFYLKGICPPEIQLTDIYRGIIPSVLLQWTGLALVFAFPALVTRLLSVAYLVQRWRMARHSCLATLSADNNTSINPCKLIGTRLKNE